MSDGSPVFFAVWIAFNASAHTTEPPCFVRLAFFMRRITSVSSSFISLLMADSLRLNHGRDCAIHQTSVQTYCLQFAYWNVLSIRKISHWHHRFGRYLHPVSGASPI